MIKVLDHGSVEVTNLAGPWGQARDIDPANAARMSFGQSNTRLESEDHKLNEYLMKNKHTTPFEMIEVWIIMKLPIFVARQFVRHRTVSINEVSGRYVTLPKEWYIPELANVNLAPERKKQGRGELADTEFAEDFRLALRGECTRSYELYLYYLNQGIAPELARLFLHLNHYTVWLWKQDLHNIMHFLSLRDHSHAQWESQQYAKAVDGELREQLPQLMGLYDKYRRME